MKTEEATYTIPLRGEVLKVAKYDRTKKAVIATKEFLIKHTKSKNIWLGPELNKKLQEKGRKKFPSKIQVKVIKDKDKLKAELVGFEIKKEEIKESKKDKKEKEKTTVEEIKKETSKESTTKEKPKPELSKEKVEKITKELPEKKENEKIRHEKIITKSEKPKHEKKKS